MIPSSTHQRFQIQRSTNEINSKRLNSLPDIKPPREVFLRVKFIRLGEVSSHSSFLIFLILHFLPSKK
jgi:hypothetical protein